MMTDWNEVVENIERAMKVSAAFHEAGEALVNQVHEDKVKVFIEQMDALQLELANIYKLIGPGSPVALDEVAEAVYHFVSGKHASYRMTPEPPGEGVS
jgi:hypothetical protein